MTHQGSILVVDDTHETLRLLTQTLTGFGYDVRPADSGELALASVAACPPELILLDIRMPDMDGFEVLRRLKAREESRDIPVLLLSVVNDTGQRVEGFKLGAVDFIPKPFQIEELLARVRAHIDLFRLRSNLEHQYRATFLSIGDGVITTDIEGRVREINPAAENLTGWTLSEARGKLLGEVFHIVNEETRATVENPVTSVLRNGVVVALANHTLLIARNGTERFIADSAAPIRDSNGVLGGVVLVFSDQTANHAAQKALRESEAHYRSLFKNMLNGFAYCRMLFEQGQPSDFIYLIVNSAFEKLTGLKDVAGKKASEAIPGIREADSGLFEIYGRVARTGVSERFETFVEALKMWFDVSVYSPSQDHFVAVFDGITERKQAEERIRAQAELLDLAQDAITVRDMNGCVQYWNKGSERLTGWSAEEALGCPIVKLLKPDPIDFERSMKALLEKGQWSGETTLQTKNGRPIVAMSRKTLVRDEHGRPKSVMTINTYITEQKKIQAQFLRSQRIEAIGTLASGIAHDLNNILAPVLMTTPLLRSAILDPDSLEILNTIEGCVKRGADVLKQLLSFARGKPGERVPLPLRHLVRDMDMIIKETFPRNIQSIVDIPVNLWPVLGDATQLYQVLMNLCINARDAMPDGGKLTIEGKNVIVDKGLASTTPDARPGSYVCVRVSDTGIGIAPENLNRIFEAFFTTKEIGKGTGLGLSTVMEIVRGHEGFVRVDSKLGQGTTFELYFPASPEAPPADTASSKTPPPCGQGEMILVVDDEPKFGSWMRHG